MARTEYYVDPAGGNDTTGDGLADGTAWATVQKALDTITQNTTDGDRINVKQNGTDTLSTALSTSTYVVSAINAGRPLVIQGYSALAGDGGVGTISGGGTVSVLSEPTTEGVQFVNMHLTNTGSNTIISLDKHSGLFDCEVDDTSGTAILSASVAPFHVVNCNIHNCSVGIDGASVVIGNYFKTGATAFTKCVRVDVTGSLIAHNIISLNDAGATGVSVDFANYCVVHGNTILNAASGTAAGILFASGTYEEFAVVFNNYIEGFVGTGGAGIEFVANHARVRSMLGNNAFFNNTVSYVNGTATDGAGTSFDLTGNDLSLGASGLAKNGSDTFANRLTYFAPTADLIDKQYPVVGG